ncbi:P-loop containing nucleoside triphosphate hydrolase protein [Paraphysoderma sedebokerense]|nr:P-loop containing nucleoside triphosphate hydrolase protein [Paraphysoderma sedebokerense]
MSVDSLYRNNRMGKMMASHTRSDFLPSSYGSQKSISASVYSTATTNTAYTASTMGIQRGKSLKRRKTKEDEGEVDYTFRICILGDVGVGKSCLIERECGDPRLTDTQQQIPTNSPLRIAFKTKTYVLQGNIIEVEWWDTPGQESKLSLTTKLCGNAAGYVFVFDVTNRQSFCNLSKWMKACGILSDGAVSKPAIIIGNKTDIDDVQPEEVNGGSQLKPKTREVSTDEAMNWAEGLNVEYHEVSATLNENIPESLGSLLVSIVNSIKDPPDLKFLAENGITPKSIAGLDAIRYRQYVNDFKDLNRDPVYVCDWM